MAATSSSSLGCLNVAAISLIPANQKLIVVDAKQPVPAAFRVLSKNNIYSAPACDPTTGEYFGFIDLLDIVTFIVNIFEEQTKKSGKKANQAQDIYTLLEQVEKFDLQVTDKVVDLSKKNPMIPVRPSTPLIEIMELFTKTGAHRVVLMEEKKVINVLTQSTVVSYLTKHFNELGDLPQKSVGELGLGYKSVISVSANATAFDAFKLMATSGTTSVAVIDTDGTLFTNLSAKDIKLIVDEALFTKLNKTAIEYVACVRQKQLLESAPVFSVHPEISFAKAVEKINFLKVHRLYVVDEHRKPVGVISLGDIIAAVVNHRQSKTRVMK